GGVGAGGGGGGGGGGRAVLPAPPGGGGRRPAEGNRHAAAVSRHRIVTNRGRDVRLARLRARGGDAADRRPPPAAQLRPGAAPVRGLPARQEDRRRGGGPPGDPGDRPGRDPVPPRPLREGGRARRLRRAPAAVQVSAQARDAVRERQRQPRRGEPGRGGGGPFLLHDAGAARARLQQEPAPRFLGRCGKDDTMIPDV